MDNEIVSIWDKKAADLTVSDQAKIAMGALAFMAVAPVVVVAVTSGARRLAEKIREHRIAKNQEITPEEGE